MNERDIQRALHFRRWKNLTATNLHLFGTGAYNRSWESDFLMVTQALFIYEWEIKLTRADFRADFRKDWKHQVLGGEEDFVGPCRFWFACPAELIQPEELPSYAGLVWIRETERRRRGECYHWAWEMVSAPRLHNTKATPKQVFEIATKLSRKWWGLSNNAQHTPHQEMSP